jgi:hypothetical protein
MSNQTQLVGIYRLFKLGRMGGNLFTKDIKVPERDLHPVHHSFAEDSNFNHKINGLWYEEDKKATELYWQKKPYDVVKEYAEFEEIKEMSPEIKEVHNRLTKMTKEELIEFAEKNDYKIKKTKSAENIVLELIEQIEAE